jgi:hypothetical protein
MGEAKQKRIIAEGLVSQAIAEHDKIGIHAASAFGHAITAGLKLLEAKEIIGHGGWDTWIAKNRGKMSGRQVRRYMYVAEYCELLPEDWPCTANLDEASISAAETFIREKRIELGLAKRRTAPANRVTPVLNVIKTEPAPDLIIPELKKLPETDQRKIIRGIGPTPTTVEDVLRSVADWNTENLEALARGIARMVGERKKAA